MATVVRTGRGANATTLVVDVTGVQTIFMVRSNSGTSVTCSNPNVVLTSFDTGSPRRNLVWSVAAGTSGNVTFTGSGSATWGYVCLAEPLSQALASYVGSNTTPDMSGIGGTASAAGDLAVFWSLTGAADWGPPPAGYTLLNQVVTQNAEPSWMVGIKTIPSGSFTIPAVVRGKSGTSKFELISWALLPPTGVDAGIPTIANITNGGRNASGTFTVALPASSLTYYAIVCHADVHSTRVPPSGWTLVEEHEHAADPDWTRWAIYRAVGTPGTTWTYNSDFQSMKVAIIGFTEAGVTTDSITNQYQPATPGTTVPTAPAVTTTGKALVARITTGNIYGGSVHPILSPPLNHTFLHHVAVNGNTTDEWFSVFISTIKASAAGTVAAATWPLLVAPGAQEWAYPTGISAAFKLAAAPIPTGSAAFTYDFATGAAGVKSMRGSAQLSYQVALSAAGQISPKGSAELVYSFVATAYGDAPTDPGVPTVDIWDGTQWVSAEILGVGDGSPTLQPCQILEPPN